MKIFGKLSRVQFIRVFRVHPEFAGILRSLRRNLQKSEKAKAWTRENGSIEWSFFYEVPFETFIALCVWISGDLEELKKCAAAEDPQEAALDWLEHYEPDVGEDATAEQIVHVCASLIALVYNWLAIGWYSTTLCDLIGRARAGDDEALFKAISVDPSCLCGPTGGVRLSRAVFETDTRFLKRLRKELKGPDPRRYMYSRHRVAEFILRDAGAFAVRGNREEMFQTISQDLGLAMKREGDPFKAWFSRVGAWQKEAGWKSTM